MNRLINHLKYPFWVVLVVGSLVGAAEPKNTPAASRNPAGTSHGYRSTQPEARGRSEAGGTDTDPVDQLSRQLLHNDEVAPTDFVESDELKALTPDQREALVEKMKEEISRSLDDNKKSQLAEAIARMTAQSENWDEMSLEEIVKKYRELSSVNGGADDSVRHSTVAQLAVLKEIAKRKAEEGLRQNLRESEQKLQAMSPNDPGRRVLESQIDALRARVANADFEKTKDPITVAGAQTLKAEKEKMLSPVPDQALINSDGSRRPIYERDGKQFYAVEGKGGNGYAAGVVAESSDGGNSYHVTALPSGLRVDTKTGALFNNAYVDPSAPVATGAIKRADGSYALEYGNPDGTSVFGSAEGGLYKVNRDGTIVPENNTNGARPFKMHNGHGTVALLSRGPNSESGPGAPMASPPPAPVPVEPVAQPSPSPSSPTTAGASNPGSAPVPASATPAQQAVSPKPQVEYPFKEIPEDQLTRLGDLRPNNKVTIFSMHNCPHCDALAQKLDERGIPYEKITLATNQDVDTVADRANLEKYRPALNQLFGNRPKFPAIVVPAQNGVRTYEGNPFHAKAKPGASEIFNQIPKQSLMNPLHRALQALHLGPLLFSAGLPFHSIHLLNFS